MSEHRQYTPARRPGLAARRAAPRPAPLSILRLGGPDRLAAAALASALLWLAVWWALG